VSENRAVDFNHRLRLVVDGSATIEAVFRVSRTQERFMILTSRNEASRKAAQAVRRVSRAYDQLSETDSRRARERSN
jgi:hypothetical protein